MSKSSISKVNLLVRFLDSTVDDVKLRQHFTQFGPVATSIVERDIFTGESRGFGFVRFVHPQDALRAFREANGKVLGSKRINLLWARQQHDNTPSGGDRRNMNKLFMRNIPPDVTSDDLVGALEVHGSIAHVSLHPDPADKRRGAVDEDYMPSRLIAFVTFAETGAALRALEAVHHTCPFPSCHGVPVMAKLSQEYEKRVRHGRGSYGGDDVDDADGVSIIPYASEAQQQQHEEECNMYFPSILPYQYPQEPQQQQQQQQPHSSYLVNAPSSVPANTDGVSPFRRTRMYPAVHVQGQPCSNNSNNNSYAGGHSHAAHSSYAPPPPQQQQQQQYCQRPQSRSLSSWESASYLTSNSSMMDMYDTPRAPATPRLLPPVLHHAGGRRFSHNPYGGVSIAPPPQQLQQQEYSGYETNYFYPH